MIDVLGPEKRRRRTTQEKIAIVQQSFEPGMTYNCARDTRRQRLTKLTPHPRAIRARALSTFLPVHIQRLL